MRQETRKDIKIWSLAVIYVIVSVLLVYFIINFWPGAGDTNENGEYDTVFIFFSYPVEVTFQIKLIISVLLAGATGAMVHTLTSFVEYVCNKKFKENWIFWYLMRPFIGMLLALIFYFVVRAGFFTKDFSAENTNEFGFLAIAALSGMFSKQATDKLKEIFDNLFQVSKKVKQKDPLENEVPELNEINPKKFPPEKKEVEFEVLGKFFVEETSVFVNESKVTCNFVSEHKLTFTYQITNKDIDKGELEGYLKNPSPGGGISQSFVVRTEGNS